MKNCRIALDCPRLNYLPCSRITDFSHIISLQVDYHIQLSTFFITIKQLIEIMCIYLFYLRLVRNCLNNTPPRAFYRLGSDKAVIDGYKHFGWGADYMKISAVDVCCISAWIIAILPVIKLYRLGIVFAFESLREINLIDLSVVDIAFYFLHRTKVVFFIHIAANMRKIYCFKVGDIRFWYGFLLGFSQQLFKNRNFILRFFAIARQFQHD